LIIDGSTQTESLAGSAFASNSLFLSLTLTANGYRFWNAFQARRMNIVMQEISRANALAPSMSFHVAERDTTTHENMPGCV
jgi:hypothetical protein